MNNNDLISKSALLKRLDDMGGCGADKNSWADGWDKAIDDVYKLVESETEYTNIGDDTESSTQTDNINHPEHYETGKYECIDVMQEAIGIEDTKGFCLCNAFKYIYRCTKKHVSPVEDVKKAIWYLNKFIELEERENDELK